MDSVPSNRIKASSIKTIVAIKNSSDKKKTETLREFASLMLTTYPNLIPILPIPAFVPSEWDFRLVVEINGIRIAIESQGDPNSKLQERLFDLADNFNVDIILCTTRTKWETVYAVEDLCNQKGFQYIWSSTYQMIGKANQDIANQAKARHLLDLLQSLALI